VDSPPFVKLPTGNSSEPQEDETPVDYSTICPVFAETGECRHGLKCRFLGGHVRKDDSGNLVLIQDEEKQARSAVSAKEVNFMSPDVLKLLRSKKVRSMQFPERNLNILQYSHPLADTYLKELQAANNESSNAPDALDLAVEAGVAEPVQPMDTTPNTNTTDQITRRTGENTSQNDTPDVPMRFAEKKRLDWAGKTCTCTLPTSSFRPYRCLWPKRSCSAHDCRESCALSLLNL
jgi:tRNA-dihydrouridine synthase 3